ncbi:hypothetical protein M409DRAFT_23480 [Zasmidium cellare ATCC 36951]|uniref:Heterokaryon incompatibility domain-containing protein n=1 Tax=Zasmidium cellare ATCC 36951 TaxID=1080233 RepID=A0A6A6CJG3_ZASCE|nr:uncharacterized protein M409DRAFT_23480 [Zasmidium cellare ATCC 36951]KAF2166290.1 hypothetical protein M409DRAFT_23480 [Zasmidium cellare ATCC 36951]
MVARETSAPSIVLLQLYPGEADQPIECSSESVLLSSDISYETLSYCWGQPIRDIAITQDGTPTLITSSLFQALRRLRRPDRARTVWIDQLCIDLSNEAERSTQVSVMQQIYRNAARGIIWLGELPTDADDCGFTAEDVENAFEKLALFDPERYDPSALGETSGDCREKLGRVILSMMGSPHATWKAVRWWRRIWTVQEAQLPPSSILQWGHLTVSFSLLKRIAVQMTRSGEYCTQWRQVFGVGWRINHFCTPLVNLQIHEPTGTLGTLFRWRERETTEPRDKIFALMGFFAEPPLPSIPSCDYSLSVVELYKLVTLDLIRENRGLLPLVGRRGEPRTTPGLPSWVFDWMYPEHPELRSGHTFFGNCRRWEHFACDGGRYIEPTVRGNDGLVLQGCRIDRIAILAPVRYVDHRVVTDEEFDDHAREIGGTFRNVFETWLDSQDPGISYIAGESVSPLDAFRRTLIGDVVLPSDYTDYRASAEDAAAVDEQLNGGSTHVFHSLRDMVTSQSFFITQNGYFGIGPPGARVGDEVWAFLCGNYPHVLRENGGSAEVKEGGFVHVGDAYVHGIMDGEVFEDMGRVAVEEVVLY